MEEEEGINFLNRKSSSSRVEGKRGSFLIHFSLRLSSLYAQVAWILRLFVWKKKGEEMIDSEGDNSKPGSDLDQVTFYLYTVHTYSTANPGFFLKTFSFPDTLACTS